MSCVISEKKKKKKKGKAGVSSSLGRRRFRFGQDATRPRFARGRFSTPYRAPSEEHLFARP